LVGHCKILVLAQIQQLDALCSHSTIQFIDKLIEILLAIEWSFQLQLPSDCGGGVAMLRGCGKTVVQIKHAHM
jgi:hypothetical protein